MTIRATYNDIYAEFKGAINNSVMQSIDNQQYFSRKKDPIINSVLFVDYEVLAQDAASYLEAMEPIRGKKEIIDPELIEEWKPMPPKRVSTIEVSVKRKKGKFTSRFCEDINEIYLDDFGE
ncbi:hypothetical protein MFMK1_000511 [Metallumcola ferriviriculae]|uniref:Uncharacterized protein n=1 Tax=Metallumcola ferriviriculae TaxID=3039180 RepID=A0AAU0UKG7_9FIRM|nr:hypothetical protein MFMK1_000511 [Desulfitibacteraceae bacterium MK1]